MTDPAENKMEWPLEEIYIKDEPPDPSNELEIRPSTKDEPDPAFENPVCCESPLSTDTQLEIKEDAVEGSEGFGKEESPPLSFDEATSILLSYLNKNSNIGTENVERKCINSREMILECSYCSMKFSQNRELEIHIVTHTGEKPHGCPYCKKKFSKKGVLQRHVLAHTGEKSYSCHYCNKKFSQKGSLQSHILTHTGEKPHQCSICNKTFRLKGHLQSHIFTHTGEKPHECSICSRKYSLKGQLQSHILTHTGEKPHKCSYCGKKCSRKADLKTHILTHTREKPHGCSVCNKKFRLKGHLQSHISTQHQETSRNRMQRMGTHNNPAAIATKETVSQHHSPSRIPSEDLQRMS